MIDNHLSEPLLSASDRTAFIRIERALHINSHPSIRCQIDKQTGKDGME
jgi:hypothetical protein